MKFFLLFLLALFLLIGGQSRVQLDRPQSLPQDPDIQIYFNHNQAQGADYADPYRQIKRRGDNLEDIIINAINSAQSTVDVAVQELRLPKIARALARQHQAGVRVRVILENIYNRPWSQFTSTEVEALDERNSDRYQDFFALADQDKDGKLSQEEIKENDAIIVLQNAEIPIIDDTEDGSKGSGLMHHKFVIVDGKIVIVTSANFTLSDIHGDMKKPDTRGNANNLLYINSSDVANIFSEEFDEMWGDGVGGNSDSKFGINKSFRQPQRLTVGNTELTIKFSPNSQTIAWQDSSNGLIGSVLDRAGESVDLALFVFSEQNLADILQTNQQRGVRVRALIDPEFAFRYYSEALDLSGVALANKCQYEANNNPWENPSDTVGVPQLQLGDKLHHKFGIVDRSIVIAGSHNWSAAANYQNDETLLTVENPAIAAHYEREFERLYSNSILGIPATVRKKIERQLEECSPTNGSAEAVQPDTDSPINLNTASQQELESLPGIGAKLADKIIQERQDKPFSSLEDLQRVPGIGKQKIEKLEDKVTW